MYERALIMGDDCILSVKNDYAQTLLSFHGQSQADILEHLISFLLITAYEAYQKYIQFYS